jgi:hypothetical protein
MWINKTITSINSLTIIIKINRIEVEAFKKIKIEITISRYHSINLIKNKIIKIK